MTANGQDSTAKKVRERGTAFLLARRVGAVAGWMAFAVGGGLIAKGDGVEEAGASAIIVVGAEGAEEYASVFAKWAGNWSRACAAGGVTATVIGLETGEKDGREELRAALEREAAEGAAELWLVLIGHGTADASGAKFNLRGDDVSAAELAGWLTRFSRPVAVAATFSASGAFLKPLSVPGRVVVTATRSGSEENFARFGQHLSEAIAEPAADADKDGQVSLLEAWLEAARRTAAFYENEGRIATEHSILDDNGDGLGTPADWFRGVCAVKKTKEGAVPDGLRAHQFHLVRNAAESGLTASARAERDAVELEVGRLRERKAAMAEEDYFRELEGLMRRLGRIYPKPSDGR